jgi:putative selenium metabolism hydrolase
MIDDRGTGAAALADKYTDDMVRFLRELIAIPSESGTEGAVTARIADEMTRAGFDEVRIDGIGNVLGRVGHGRSIVAIDGHVDTVGIGVRSAWKVDPYAGAVAGGIVYGRGASDQKGGIAAAVYGARIIKDLGIGADATVWVTGTVMEEDCDGLCWQYLLGEHVLRPDVVVITEATNLGVYRGHRGRLEIEVRTEGRSCHGSAPERGVNAVYRMAPIIADIERMNDELAAAADPFLGKGTVTISEVRSTSPSLCAVADSSTIHLDRRLTRGETLESAVDRIRALESVRRAGATVTVLDYARASYTGLIHPTRKYYPTWILAEDHPAVRAAVQSATTVLGRAPSLGRWVFSTNGVATAGMFGVPTVGFGPGNEIHAHTPDDQCPIADLTRAAHFYAVFPRAFAQTMAGDRGRTDD